MFFPQKNKLVYCEMVGWSNSRLNHYSIGTFIHKERSRITASTVLVVVVVVRISIARHNSLAKCSNVKLLCNQSSDHHWGNSFSCTKLGAVVFTQGIGKAVCFRHYHFDWGKFFPRCFCFDWADCDDGIGCGWEYASECFLFDRIERRMSKICPKVK